MRYELRDCSYAPGGHVILSHIDFEIKSEDKIAVVGRNGIGKTTLLRMLAGEITPDRDDKRTKAPVRMSEDISIGVFSQSQMPDTGNAGNPAVHVDGDTDGGAAAGYCRPLSGGQETRRRLVELFETHPDLLLLDEPTNHLDVETVEWLEAYLMSYKGAVVVVSHDRFFLDRVACITYELAEGGVLTRYAGNYSAYKKEKAEAAIRARAAAIRQNKEIERLNTLIEKFKRKPRKAAMARAKRTQLERMKKIAPTLAETPEPTRRIIPQTPGPKVLWQAKDLVVGYETKKPLYTVSMKITRGQRIGLLGRNGCGKSALLKTVAGLIPPLKGQMQTGEGAIVGYFDQHEAEKLALDAEYASLSGGERAKLALKRIIEAAPNFLILDEPTNHMDIAAQESIEQMLECYEGTVIFASHDRYFLNRIADTLIVFEAGDVRFCPFGYEHYLYRKQQALRYRHAAAAGAVDAGNEDTDGVHGHSGDMISGVYTQEDMLLIEELRAVPDKERGMTRRIPTAQLAAEWDTARAWERCEACEEAAVNAQLRYYFQDGTRAEMDETRNEWTLALLEWYDVADADAPGSGVDDTDESHGTDGDHGMDRNHGADGATEPQYMEDDVEATQQQPQQNI